jgi:hypothetical protein
MKSDSLMKGHVFQLTHFSGEHMPRSFSSSQKEVVAHFLLHQHRGGRTQHKQQGLHGLEHQKDPISILAPPLARWPLSRYLTSKPQFPHM